LSDLDTLSYGQVIDMMVEKANDSYEYDDIATQDDMDKF
jgi:hypothetical protein